MNISLRLMEQFVDFVEKDPKKIAEVLTEKSAEVDEIVNMGENFQHVVVGEILEIASHPDADKIRITQTKVGENDVRQIVCGAKNIEVGMKVPVALPGAVLPGNFAISEGKIRGVESKGMICAAQELGLEKKSEGVLVLGKNATVGMPFAEFSGMDDIVLVVENTTITNRPDLFSHRGFGREMVACGLAKEKYSDISTAISDHFTTEETKKFPVELSFGNNSIEMLKSYAAVVVEGVDGSVPSPQNLQNILRSLGMNPKNALVDITNFIMFAEGMPLHAFDLERTPKKWEFQLSKGGEKMINLDGDEKILPENAIILKDENGEIFDLCGIQGGKNSGIEATTKKILLHAPVYDPVKIRRASLAVSQRTDASVIYEKGVAPELAIFGLKKAIQLLLSIFPEAKIFSPILEQYFVPREEKVIALKKSLVDRVLDGLLTEEEMLEILKNLGFSVVPKGEILEVTVPFFRTDIAIPEDLVEEIARMYGLNRIPGVSPEIFMEEKPKMLVRAVEQRIANVMVKNGFFEILTYAFLGEKLLSRAGISVDEQKMLFVKNPISEEMEIMRTSLTPRLLETAEKNRRYCETFRIFESGKIFSMENGEKVETSRITALLVGEDFFAAKAVAEEIFATFFATPRMEKTDFGLAFAHPGRSAKMIAGKDAVVKILEIHPKIAKEFNLPKNSSIVCVNFAPFENFLLKKPSITALPKFPAIDFDISVLCDKKTQVGDLVKGMDRVDALIVRSEVLDVWEGKGVEEGKKSVTLSFSFRAEDRTLTETEAKNLEKKILENLEKKGAKFRFAE